MTDGTTEPGGKPRRRIRFVPLAWAGSAAAATILVLGVNGTLSAWSSAIITNSNDTVSVSNAVTLQETGPAPTSAVCNSTDSDSGSTGTNSSSCGTINKYGGGTLAPGGSQTVTVTMKNTGTEVGALTLKANGCSASGGNSANTNTSLCNGPLTVSVSCGTPGTVVVPASTPTAFNGLPAAAVGSLAAGASTTCTFTVALASNASAQFSGQSILQALVWTLSGA